MDINDLLARRLLNSEAPRGQDSSRIMALRLQQPQAPSGPLLDGASVWAHALTLGLNGLRGGFMEANADRREKEREDRRITMAANLEEKRGIRNQEALAAGPPEGVDRRIWLAELAGNGNNAANARLTIEREDFNRTENQRIRQEDREFQARLAAANRAPRAPSEFDQMLAAAGIAPGSPEAQAIGRQLLERRVNPQPVDPRAGLNPVQAYDADGNPTILLPRTDGTVVRPALPEGVTLTPRTREINTGTEIQTVDQGGRVLQSRPINIRGREAQEVEGRDAGTQNVAAPGVVRQAEQSLALIDGALNHGALSTATGMLSPLGSVAGTPQFDFAQRVAQLQGRAFLDAFESLRGGGAITQIEGEKATQAIARLNRSASARDFREALQELREVVEAGRARAAARLAPPQAQIGGSGLAADPPQRAAPQAGIADGTVIRNPQTGERLRMQGGQWVPAQ